MIIQHLNLDSQPHILDNISLAVGYFDGIHLGHQELIIKAKSLASQKGLKSAVLSFDPNPLLTLGILREDHYLTSLKDREAILESFGIDYFFILDFSKEVSTLSPKEFVEKFLLAINVKELVCGFDFYFGYKGQGNSEFLKTYDAYFNLTVIDKVVYKNEKISSTRIHDALNDGNIALVNKLLTRPYKVSGVVVEGKKRGRQLGFPTANIDYHAYYLPKHGVYACRIIVEGKEYRSMANIGLNPTFNDIFKETLEVHIFDFDQFIYGQMVVVYFDAFIRDEVKFTSKEQLIDQLNVDKKSITYFYEKSRDLMKSY